MRPRRSTVVLARRTCGSFGLRVLDHIVVGHGTEILESTTRSDPRSAASSPRGRSAHDTTTSAASTSGTTT